MKNKKRNEETKEQIIDVLMAIYNIPGEFFIIGIISIGIGKIIPNYGWILILFGTICFVLEIISPIIAGIELYKKAIKNIKRFFENNNSLNQSS